MTETIGWWDYDETDRPTLINRDSGERVRMGEEVSIAGKRPGQRWVRFDYLHQDLEFPVLVCWMPEEGRIVVDYLASADLWRQESNADFLHPPYGTWVRVDDCVIDALWSWPGTLERMYREPWDQKNHRIADWIGRIGGWCNGAWRPEFWRIDVVHGAKPPNARQYRLERLMALDESAPSPWFFIDVTLAEQYERLGFGTWEGEPLFEDEEGWGDDVYYKTPGIYESGGRRTVEIRNMVPQARSRDGCRLLFPKSAYIIHQDGLGDGPADLLSFQYCRRDFGNIRVRYSRAGPWSYEPSQQLHLEVWPRFNFIGLSGEVRPSEKVARFFEAQKDVVKRPNEGVFHLLSISAQRWLSRDVTDAFLFWDGTKEAPELWGSSMGPYLTYEKPQFIVSENVFVGGQVAPVKSFAALQIPDLWRSKAFDLKRFTGEKE